MEITGYVRMVSATNNNNTYNGEYSVNDDTTTELELDFRARTSDHNSENPCEGTSMIGLLHADSAIGWKKEIWHT